jgi:hypothetical protein
MSQGQPLSQALPPPGAMWAILSLTYSSIEELTLRLTAEKLATRLVEIIDTCSNVCSGKHMKFTFRPRLSKS